ncbi:hypothetical protein [Dysgonomonas sp. 511]|uniref:hypothetical protein n=1 Tax=Dysgonomonas sp. 511 TaxID=2302930 RepID=UPI0013D85149|nr:hypothetical protein [Dysgonomonas sp. 511]
MLNLENKEPLPELRVGDVVMLSDYPMTVTKVSGANGNFSGEGWVPVNWLLETKWAVEFNNIRVNTDYRLIGGSVRAQYDKDEGNIANLNEAAEALSDLWKDIKGIVNELYDRIVEERDFNEAAEEFIDSISKYINENAELTEEQKQEILSVLNNPEFKEKFITGLKELKEDIKNNGLDKEKFGEVIKSSLVEATENVDRLDTESKNREGIYMKGKAWYAMPGGYIIELEDITIKHICVPIFKDYLFSFKDKNGKFWIPNNTEYSAAGYNFTHYVNQKNKSEVYKDNIRLLKENDVVNRITFDSKTSSLSVNRVHFSEKLEKDVKSPGYVYSIFEKAAGFKNQIKETKVIIEPTLIINNCEDNFNIIETIKDKSGKYVTTITYNKARNLWQASVKLAGSGDKTRQLADGTTVIEKRADLEKELSRQATEKLNELGGLNGKKSKEVSRDITEDEGEFWVKQMNGREWISTICDLGSEIWDNATLPEGYWNKDKSYSESNIHIPPTLAGVSDGVIDQVMGYQQLAKLGYDIATKKEVREGIWTSVKNITPGSIVSMATEGIKGKIEKYNFSDKSYLGYHEIGKDGVLVVSMAMGAGFLSKADDAVEKSVKETGEYVKNALKKELDELNKYFNTQDFVKRLNDRWGKYKGALSRAEWETRYKQLIINRKLGKVGEEAYQDIAGGVKPRKAVKTSDGNRHFDNVLDDTAREVKTGPVSFNKYKDQIMKDIDILSNDRTNGLIKNIEWHCFDGVDDAFEKQLKDVIKKAGLPDDAIKYIDYVKELDL